MEQDIITMSRKRINKLIGIIEKALAKAGFKYKPQELMMAFICVEIDIERYLAKHKENEQCTNSESSYAA